MECNRYVLTDVLLETGFVYKDEQVCGTKTELHDIGIEDGKITEVALSSEKGGMFTSAAASDFSKAASFSDFSNSPRISCGGRLALPLIREMHCHPDKTFLGGRWKAPEAVEISDIIGSEMEYMVETSRDEMENRAEAVLGMMIDYGSRFIRAHVDIHELVGHRNLFAVKSAFEEQTGLKGYEIAAFPQEGLLKGKNRSLVRSALKNGADIVGGIDPSWIEGDQDKAVNVMVELAVESGAGIDLHCHETGSEGIKSLTRFAEAALEAGLKGNLEISHGFALGSASEKETEALMELMKEGEIELITAVLLSDPIPDLPRLMEYGIKVQLGSDNIYDCWNPFGNGDMVERLERVCQIYSWFDEYSVSRSLRLITGGVTPLDDRGERVWPLKGDDADFLLVEAGCSAQMIARRCPRRSAIVGGRLML